MNFLLILKNLALQQSNSNLNRMEVPHVHISIKENSFLRGAKEILKYFRPDWDTESVQFKVFTQGITNKLLGCFNDCYPDDIILIRVYGHKTDILIDRSSEKRNLKVLHMVGFAPKLYGTFNNGLVYEYVPGEVLTTTTCCLENIFELVAKKLAHMHSIRSHDFPMKEPAMWRHMKKFLCSVPFKFSEDETEDRYNELFKKKLDVEVEYKFLQEKFSNLKSSVVFCHNDLLLSNIVYNSDANTVTFIDYEYGGYNYQAYDIANHFNEYAGVENPDFSLYPDESFQKNWLMIYLKEYKRRTQGIDDAEVSEEEINKFYEAVQKFSLISHFIWGLWCLVQVENSTLDFDFLNYGFLRFQEYFNKKKVLFPHSSP